MAATDSTVLLLGETGTGKERFAAYIHQLSARRAREMVCVNCAAIPATLIESELFGRERGAYTDANSQQIGRFELAHRSTIFLDEIGDLPFEVQVKLLRVLEERQIERLGSVKSINVDTRIIAATHRSLEQRIAEGGFRADLFYRLNVFPLRVPPLRERAEDIPLLVWRFIEEFSTTFGKRIEEVPAENMAALQRYALAGEHPGTAERRRAGDDSRQRTAADRVDPDTAERGASEKPAAGRRPEGAHSPGPGNGGVARPGIRRRRGSTGAPSDHAGDSDGQTRPQPAESLLTRAFLSGCPGRGCSEGKKGNGPPAHGWTVTARSALPAIRNAD